ncbi:hypothetical protein [Corallibacter sp.]|uniref:hypothetical protein n=1 Tax=Corallibacter sp. TaxID=2038084 RepID=UPI003A909DB8
MKQLLLIFTILSAISVSAQIDNGQESTSIPAIQSEDVNTNNSFSIKPNTPKKDDFNGLSVPKSKPLNTESEGFSMFGEEFGNPGELYEKKVTKHLEGVEEEGGYKLYGSEVDQYLGDYKTKASKVNVVYRDFGAFDGDRVRVFVNDDVVRPSELLKPGFSGFKLDLVPGFNKIDFLALNEGESSPNTAELQILDEEGKVIASGRWNLLTGVKATLIVVKE